MTAPFETDLPAGLPPGAQVQRVAFVAGRAPGQAVLVEFPPPVNRLAVLAGGEPAAKVKPVPAYDDVFVLSAPAPVGEDAGLTARVREWVDAAAPGGPPSQVVLLQGAQVVWAAGRVAVVAAADRLEAVRRAAVEVAYYDAELLGLERELGGLWPDLEADAPLAFEFDARSLPERRRLAGRFRQVLLLRARLARVTPQLLLPPAYPPTLASQVGERLRERVRATHRVEALAGQLEVFERVYDGCGQRASDFALARAGHTLEWVIIALLLTQTALTLLDLFGGLRS